MKCPASGIQSQFDVISAAAQSSDRIKIAILNLLKERQKWLSSSDFVKAILEIKSRSQVRVLLRQMEKSGKVVIEQNPKRERGYIFGLPDWKKPNDNMNIE